MYLYNTIRFIQYIPYFIKIFKKYGSNLYEFSILSIIYNSQLNTTEHGVYNVLRNSLTRKTIKRYIGKLIEKGLIIKDNRAVRLTNKGINIVESVNKDIEAFEVIKRYELRDIVEKLKSPAPLGDKTE
jgi:predicted transcriptional regulator